MQHWRVLNTILPILVLSLLLCGTAHGARYSAWRELGREARGSLKNGDNLQALAGYRKALASLKSENPNADEQYDLELMIADVLRREHRYGEAELILNRLSPIIKRGKYLDPMLACRYHRRRSELMFSVNRVDDALSSLRDAGAVKERYFFKDHGGVIKERIFLLEKLREFEHWQDWQAIVKRWYKQIGNGPAPESLSKEYKQGLTRMHLNILRSLAGGRLEQSEKLLKLCKEIECNYDKLFDLWGYHLYHCYALQKPVETRQALVEIPELLAYVVARPRLNLTVRRLVATRLGLMTVYLEDNQTELAKNQSEEIETLIAKKLLNPLEKRWLELDAVMRLSMIELRVGYPISDSMIARLESSTSGLSKLLLDPDLNRELARSVWRSLGRGRLNLVLACVCYGRIDETEREISKLPEPSQDSSKDFVPFYPQRLANLYARLAKAELDRSENEKASHYVQIARKLLVNRPKPPSNIVHERSFDSPTMPIIDLVEKRLENSPR